MTHRYIFKANQFSENIPLKKASNVLQPTFKKTKEKDSHKIILNRKALQVLAWFNNHILRAPKKTSLQQKFGWLGIIIGATSSAVNLSFGFAFGKNLALKVYLSNNLSRLVGGYFGFTAVTPLALLAARTSYTVFQQLAAPLSAAEKIVNKNRNVIFSFLLNCLVFFLAGLSALPYLYLTHKTLAQSLGYWALLFDIQAFIAPTLVNSWALSYVIKIFQTSLKDWQYKLFHKRIKLKPARLAKAIKFELRGKLLEAIRVIELMKRKDIKTLYEKIYTIENTNKMIKLVKKNDNSLIYYKFVDSLKYLFHPNRVFDVPHVKIKPDKPLLRIILGILGGIIGTVSAYQYLGNGKEAAIWLHASSTVALGIGIASLICNGALGGLTASIVFEEFYIWLSKINLKIKALLGICKKPMHYHVPKFSEIFTSLHFSSSIYENGFFLVKIIIALIAISAATPNVYLTLQQSSTVNMTIFTYLLLICSFLGPFATNFYAISKVIEQNSRRQILIDAILKLIDTIEDMKLAHAKALTNLIIDSSDYVLHHAYLEETSRI